MAYYNPYYNPYLNSVDTPKTGDDFLRDTGVNMNKPKASGLQVPQSQYNNGGGQGMNYGNIAASAIGGLTNALSEQGGDPKNFSIDPYAGLKGSAEGFASGGWVGAVIGGITSQIGTFGQVNRNLKNLDTGVSATSTDAMGRVGYNANEISEASANLKALREGQDKVKKAWDPGTQIFRGLYGTSRKIRRKERELRRNLRGAQDSYNDAIVAQNQQDLAMDRYNNLLNNETRLNNLYSIGNRLY